MESQDLLNFFLILGFVIITACIVFATFYFVQTLKSITTLADNLDNLALGVKDKIALKTLAAIPAVLIALIGKIIKNKRG